MTRLASVSTATVSYVLNNAQGRRISPETRDAVYRAAKLLSYRPNLAARNLARGKSGVVLYVVPHVAVSEMRVEHLVERGHRRIAVAYTGITRWRPLGDYWFEGVSRAAQLGDLPPVRVGEVTLDNAADVVSGWVGDGVTAVCAQSDEIACLVLDGLYKARLRCPGDLAVIGVDASPMGMVSTPPLTTVQFDPCAVADAALAAVFERLGHPAPPSPELTDIARLVVRSST